MSSPESSASSRASPSGDSGLPPHKRSKFKRNYLACLNCRTRKVKCDLGDVDNPHEPPCARCRRERKECVFVDSKRGGSKNVVEGRRRRKMSRAREGSLNDSSSTGSSANHIPVHLPVPPTLQTLQSQYGTSFPIFGQVQRPTVPEVLQPQIPPIPQIQQIPQVAQQQQQPLPAFSTQVHSPVNLPGIQNAAAQSVQINAANGNATNPPLSPRMYSDQPLTNNATMVFLAHIAGKIARADQRDRIDGKEKVEQLEANMNERRSSKGTPNSLSGNPSAENLTELPKETFGHASDLFPTIREDRYEMPPVKSTLAMRITPTAKLSDIEYIGPDGIMTETEARKLIDLFFTTMHPFFPYIPEELRTPDVLPGYPMLLCSILTVAARYHVGIFEKKQDAAAAVQVHEQLWVYCQRLFSMTVWGEKSSRSVGTLLSFLLFTEWNPRAIHFRWNDYANVPEDDPPQEEYAGLSAMKRSELMSFMLIGTAARLSFLLPDHPLTFLATHVAETHTAIGLNKRSMLAQTLTEVDIDAPRWGFTPIQKATLELLQFFSLCYETLYGQHPKFGRLNKYQNLAILDILSPILENWYQKYHKLLKPSNPHSLKSGKKKQDTTTELNTLDWLNVPLKTRRDLAAQIERESLILDYYYTKLYLYSLALSGDTSVTANFANSKKGRNLRMDELVRYSRYVELAYKAAKEVLAVAQRVHRLKMLKFMPVRWVTRIIKSVSFIVKCYLTLTTDMADNNIKKGAGAGGGTNSAILHFSVIPLEEIVTLLQKTAICLRDAAPDELHLATRYSTILMYLCSQFKSKMRDHHERMVVDYESRIAAAEAREENEKRRQAQSAPAPITGSSNGVTSTSATADAFAKPVDQQLFDDYFSHTDPSETLFTWFAANNSPGLDFVDQFTKEMEMEFINKGGDNLARQG